MQSITTKYIGPGNTTGSRITARASGGCRRTVAYDYELDTDANHDAAANALVRRLGNGWIGDWVRGSKKSDDGYVYVQCAGDIKRFG